jgi:eukaryotic-like serine/threonine-protein kinase
MIAATIGPYEIQTELGRGAYGVVWMARHRLLPDRVVALKLLSEHHWSSPQARARFLREAMAVSKLDHPGIATLYDAEEHEGQLYIAFQFIDGKSVAQEVFSGRMELRRAVSIARDAAAALAHAHAQGVIHRDVSPGNIMVDRLGRGVLVDFGLARSGGPSATASAGVVAGTLAYMAPEVLRGEPADARSDVYGLGAVLYRMVTGRLPFEGDQAEEIAFKIVHARPAAPSALDPTIPFRVDEIVLRALERDPRDRYASASEMTSSLGRFLHAVPKEGDGRVSTGSRLLSKLRLALRRRSSRVAVGTAAVLIVAGVAVGTAWMRGWRPGFMVRVPVVAVLPARNLSEDPGETGYLAEALGEELVSRLSQVSNLRLVPWLTTSRFGNPKQELKAVGQELGADKIVVASYRSDGDRVRVTMTVVEARTGLQSWLKVYDESIDDLFTLQQGIAAGIASALRANLSNAEREKLGVATSSNPEAYEFYLRGSNYMNSSDPEVKAMAGLYFERALELEPALAPAWVGLGAVRTDLFFRGQGGMADLSAAEEAFRQALHYNPRLYTAVRGLIRVYYELGQSEKALALVKSLENDSDDPEALLARGWGYTLAGLPDKAVPLFDRVLELDPASQAAAWFRVIAASWAGYPTLVVEHSKSYLKRYGEDPEVLTWFGLSLWDLDRTLDARVCFAQSLELFGTDQSNMYSALCAVNAFRGLGEKARADSLASHWLKILDARLLANPDNMRVRIYGAALAAGLGLPRGIQTMDSVLVDRELSSPGTRTGMHQGYVPLGGMLEFGDVGKIRRLFRALQNSDTAMDFTMVRNGSLKLTFRERLPEIQRLPEFQSYLAEVERRHAELAAMY